MPRVACFFNQFLCFCSCRRQRSFSRKEKSRPSIVEKQPAKVKEFLAIKNACYEPEIPHAFNEGIVYVLKKKSEKLFVVLKTF